MPPVHGSSLGTFFSQKLLIFFLFLHKNIYCGHSLEASYWSASNEYKLEYKNPLGVTMQDKEMSPEA